MRDVIDEIDKNKWDDENWDSSDGYRIISGMQFEDGRFFTGTENSGSGEVSGETVFSYHQKDDIIWAEYSGGNIVKGVLFGTMDSDHQLHFDYRQINTDGELKSGSCVSKPCTENGKLRLYENWMWADGRKGTSVIEEI